MSILRSFFKRDIEADGAAFICLTVALLLGVGAINLYGSRFSPYGWVKVSSTGFVIAGAALCIGAGLGFLFAVPRTLQAQTAEGEGTTYLDNTNLEQISDWLTKILVGVGLTQIGQLSDQSGRLAEFLAPSLGGGETAEVFGLALVLYYVISGFLLAYLWTRVFFAAVLRRARLSAEIAKSGVPLSPAEHEQIMDLGERLTTRRARALWVARFIDTEATRALESLGIEADVTASGADAERMIREGGRAYDFIICDMDEGGQLITRLGASALPPVIFYDRNVTRDVPTPTGALGVTNSADELRRLVLQALRSR